MKELAVTAVVEMVTAPVVIAALLPAVSAAPPVGMIFLPFKSQAIFSVALLAMVKSLAVALARVEDVWKRWALAVAPSATCELYWTVDEASIPISSRLVTMKTLLPAPSELV